MPSFPTEKISLYHWEPSLLVEGQSWAMKTSVLSALPTTVPDRPIPSLMFTFVPVTLSRTNPAASAQDRAARHNMIARAIFFMNSLLLLDGSLNQGNPFV